MSDSDFFAPSGGGGVGTSTILAGTGITVTTAGAGKVTIADQELWHLLHTNGLPFYFVSQTDPGADYTTMTAADLAVGAAQPQQALGGLVGAPRLLGDRVENFLARHPALGRVCDHGAVGGDK